MISLLHKSKINHHISRHESYDSFSSFHEDINSPLGCMYNNSGRNNENGVSSNSHNNFPMNSIPLSKVPKIGGGYDIGGNLQTESHEAPAKYSNSVTGSMKPKNNSTKLNVIGEHDAIESNGNGGGGISKENLIKLEMLPLPYLENCVNFDLPSLVLKANIGMKRGVKPVLADGAMGGTYFLRDENQKFAVVCKPGDEEPNSPHNPHQQSKQQQSGGETAIVWRGWYRGRIVPGFGMYREVAVFLLDAGFAGVPPTQLARVRDYLLRLEAEPLVQNKSSMLYEPLPPSAASVYKICSVQSYARHECSAEDMGSSKFYTDDVHRIAALDIRLCNLDRHEGNILVTKSNPYIRNIDNRSDDDDNTTSGNAGKYHLVPIDHGYVLPHVLCMNDPSLSWMNWSQSREPLSPSLLRHIASLDYTRDAELLRRVVGAALAETSLLTLQVCTSFLKKGSAAGLTLYEMGTAMCPPQVDTTIANGDNNNSSNNNSNNNSSNIHYNNHRTSSQHSTTSSNNHHHNSHQPISQLQKVVHIAVHNVLLMQTSRTSSFSKTDFESSSSSSNSNTATASSNNNSTAATVTTAPIVLTATTATVVTEAAVSAALKISVESDDDDEDNSDEDKHNESSNNNIIIQNSFPQVTVTMSTSSTMSSSSTSSSVSPVSVTQLLELEMLEMQQKEKVKTAEAVIESVTETPATTTREDEVIITSLSQSNLKKHTINNIIITTADSNNNNETTTTSVSAASASATTAVHHHHHHHHHHHKSMLSQTSEKLPYGHNHNHNSNNNINQQQYYSPTPSLASTSGKSNFSSNNHNNRNHLFTRSLTLSYAAVVAGCSHHHHHLHHSKNSRSSSVDETVTSVTESTVRVTEEMLYRALYIDKAYQNQQQQLIQYQQQLQNHNSKNDSSSVSSPVIHSVLEYELDMTLDKLVNELLAMRDDVQNDKNKDNNDDEEVIMMSLAPPTPALMSSSPVTVMTTVRDGSDGNDEDGMEGVDVGID